MMLLAAALAARIPRLADLPDHDEQSTLDRHVAQPIAVIVRTYGAAQNHPLYSVTAHFFWIASPTLVAIRLPALLAGLGSVLALWFWLRPLTGPVPAAWAAAAIALAPPQVVYSARARGYSMLVLGTIISCWLLTRALARGRRRDWLAYGGALVLTAYAHLWALFLLVGHAAFVLVASRAGRTAAGSGSDPPGRRCLVVFAGVSLAVVSFVGLLYAPMMRGIVAMLSEKRETIFWPELAQALIWNWDFGLPEASIAVAALAAFLVLVSFADATLFREPIAWLGGLPLVTTLIVVACVRPANFYPRFLLFLFPLALILTASLLRSFPGLQRGPATSLPTAYRGPRPTPVPLTSRSWCVGPTVSSRLLADFAAILLTIAVGMLLVGQATGGWQGIAGWYPGFAWAALVGWVAAWLCGGVRGRWRGGFRAAMVVTLGIIVMDLASTLIDVERIAIQTNRTFGYAMAFAASLALVVWTALELEADGATSQTDGNAAPD